MNRRKLEDIEVGLGSVGRLRILRKLIRNPDGYFTKYALEQATGIKPVAVRSDLKVLVDLDWVKEFPHEPKTYRINMENEVVKHIAEFFRKISSGDR